MALPNEIIAIILNNADLSIDDRLEFRKQFGTDIKWNRVEVNPGFAEKMRVICERRTRNFAKYTRLLKDDSFRWSTTLDITPPLKVDNNTYVEISVSDFGGQGIEMCVKTTRINDFPAWAIRIMTTCCDMNTGKEFA